MVCKVCGTENAEDALFCKQCGNRLDGKVRCKNCNAENEADARFCNKCGSPLTLVTATKATNVIEPNGEVALQPATNKALWQKIVEIVGWSLAMLGLFFSLLFTFLIGTGLNVSTGSSDSLGIGRVGSNIYYFFSDVYKDIDMQLGSFATDEELVAWYLPAVIGTITAATVIITVFILAVVAICRFFAYARGKGKKDFAKPTMAAYAMFMIGSLVILSLYHFTVRARYSYASVSMSASLTLTSATVAGLAVAGVSLFIFVACRVAVKGKEIVKDNNFIRHIFAFIALLFIAVLLGFLPRGAVGSSDSSSYVSQSMAISFMDWMQFGIIDIVPETIGILIVACVALLVQVALIAVAVSALLNQLFGVLEGRKYNPLKFSIPVFVLAIVYLALSVAFGYLVKDSVGIDEGMTFTSPIVVLVFSVLYFAISIVQSVFRGKKEPALVSNN